MRIVRLRRIQFQISHIQPLSAMGDGFCNGRLHGSGIRAHHREYHTLYTETAKNSKKSIPESVILRPGKESKTVSQFSGAFYNNRQRKETCSFFNLAKNKRKFSSSQSFCLKAFVDGVRCNPIMARTMHFFLPDNTYLFVFQKEPIHISI